MRRPSKSLKSPGSNKDGGGHVRGGSFSSLSDAEGMQTGSTLQNYLSLGRTESKKGKEPPSVLHPSESDQQLNLNATETKGQGSGKMRSFAVRTLSTVVLIAGFLAFLWAGHVPLMFLVLIIQALMVREAFSLGRMDKEEEALPGFRALQWYFFWVSLSLRP